MVRCSRSRLMVPKDRKMSLVLDQVDRMVLGSAAVRILLGVRLLLLLALACAYLEKIWCHDLETVLANLI